MTYATYNYIEYKGASFENFEERLCARLFVDSDFIHKES